MKTRPCSDRNHQGKNPVPVSEFYAGQAFCKECAKRRVYEHRAVKRSLGLKDNDPISEIKGYLDRHLRRRKKEAELAATFEAQEVFSFEDEVSRKPMFMVESQPKKLHNWKIA